MGVGGRVELARGTWNGACVGLVARFVVVLCHGIALPSGAAGLFRLNNTAAEGADGI